MWWNDWKFQLHWNMLEQVNPKSTTKRVKTFSVSLNKFYINNNDRTAHFVGHSKLTPLDCADFYERKQINENMETEMKEMNKKQWKTLSRMMKILMKRSQSKLEKKEQQKHTKILWTKILNLLKRMRIVKRSFKEQNGEQY